MSSREAGPDNPKVDGPTVDRKRVPVVPSRLRILDDAGTRGVLLGSRCRQCGEHFFGFIAFCQSCTSADIEPVELGNCGTLRSYTIVRVPPAGWPGPVPYALGQVEMPQGPNVISEVVGCPFEELRVGMSMSLALAVGGQDGDGNDVIVYKWRPSS